MLCHAFPTSLLLFSLTGHSQARVSVDSTSGIHAGRMPIALRIAEHSQHDGHLIFHIQPEKMDYSCDMNVHPAGPLQGKASLWRGDIHVHTVPTLDSPRLKCPPKCLTQCCQQQSRQRGWLVASRCTSSLLLCDSMWQNGLQPSLSAIFCSAFLERFKWIWINHTVCRCQT